MNVGLSSNFAANAQNVIDVLMEKWNKPSMTNMIMKTKMSMMSMRTMMTMKTKKSIKTMMTMTKLCRQLKNHFAQRGVLMGKWDIPSGANAICN